MLGGKFHEDWKFGLVLNFIQKGQDKQFHFILNKSFSQRRDNKLPIIFTYK
jgi:hypothetical protein